jgi:hypothetical protein
VIGIGYFEPEAKRLKAAVELHGGGDPDVRRRVANLKLVGRIELAVLYVVVASMVIKPTGDDGAVLFAFVLLLSAAAAGALVWRRRLTASAGHP